MYARLWWKEARQTWPAWAFLAVAGLGVQVLIRILAGPGPEEGYFLFAALATMIYLFLIAAASFAGEREDGTLGLLDALPVDRARLWAAKASYALVSTLALGTLLWLSTLAFVGVFRNMGSVTAALLLWSAVALGWGLLWSAVLNNAMFAAIAAMASVGATLMALVNLAETPSDESGLLLIAVALATAAASAFAFVRTGPPGWRGPRPRPPMPLADRPINAATEPAAAGRPPRVWPFSVGRLAWATWRQIRADLKMLLAVAIGSLIYLRATEWDRLGRGAPLLVLAMMIIGVMAGVAAFGSENRGRTHRFLHQHGARPGVVWGVKMASWWLAAFLFWLLMLALTNFGIGSGLGLIGLNQPSYPHDPTTVAALGFGALTIPFALGALCGMVFRRGITAGAMAVVGLIVLGVVLGFPISVGIMGPSALVNVALALVAITWAWSGDWLRYAPGLAKWGRLALWCVAALAVLVPGYIRGRVADVPALSAEQARDLFQPERIARPSSPDDNAAPLYWEAGKLVQAADEALGEGTRLLYEVQNAPPSDPKVVAWLEGVEPALALLREGARRPNCVYEDPAAATIRSGEPSQPSYNTLTIPLIVSVGARLDRGDLDGSWEEVETLLRMARQYSAVRGRSYFQIESQAVAQALRWAADARQTAESLEWALAAYRDLPPGATPADRARVERAVFQNTMRLPSDELIDAFLPTHGPNHKVSTADALMTRAVTTPWEVARARRVYDLLAGTWIQALGDRPYGEHAPVQPWWFDQSAEQGGFSNRGADGASRWIGRPELVALVTSTPVVNQSLPGFEARQYPRVETNRRALAMVLRLRLYQARHDGALPRSLDETLSPSDSAEMAVLESTDPYGKGRFGYVESAGQLLIPLELAAFQEFTSIQDSSLVQSDGCRLLYSVGPDGVDDRAAMNVNFRPRGDIVFPLKDGVKPPPTPTP